MQDRFIPSISDISLAFDLKSLSSIDFNASHLLSFVSTKSDHISALQPKNHDLDQTNTRLEDGDAQMDRFFQELSY
jgi:hypothetical protein